MAPSAASFAGRDEADAAVAERGPSVFFHREFNVSVVVSWPHVPQSVIRRQAELWLACRASAKSTRHGRWPPPPWLALRFIIALCAACACRSLPLKLSVRVAFLLTIVDPVFDGARSAALVVNYS